jgi:DNA-binding MarR family transcriptional regulator
MPFKGRTPPRPPHFDSPQQETYLNLWRTYDRLRLLEDELFGRHDLTAQQYNALRLLRAAHPKKLATLGIAAGLISRSPDITRLLNKLHHRGLIDRERPSGNRRVVSVGITIEGLALVKKLGPKIRGCHMKQLGHLSNRERAALVKLLAKARRPHETDQSGWR